MRHPTPFRVFSTAVLLHTTWTGVKKEHLRGGGGSETGGAKKKAHLLHFKIDRKFLCLLFAVFLKVSFSHTLIHTHTRQPERNLTILTREP